MNIYIYVGFFLIFLGTAFTYYGAKIENDKTKENVTEQLEDFRSEIESEKDESSSEERKLAVEKIQNQFNEWANTFKEGKAELAIKQKKRVLSHEEEQIKESNFWSKYISHFNKTLNQLIEAISEDSDLSITSSDIDMPQNLFVWYREGKIDNYFEIQFKENKFWLIEYYVYPGDSLMISININDESITTTEGGMRRSYYMSEIIKISLNKKSNNIEIETDSPIFSDPALSGNYSLKDYDSVIAEILKNLIGSQIVEL